MKAAMVACWGTLLVSACSAAKADASHILSQLGGDQDNARIAELQARNSGSLCSLVTPDGLARLMSFGDQAVVDIGGKAIVLAYHPGHRERQASFTAPGIRVSGALARQEVRELGKTASHEVIVEVEASGHTGRLHAEWTCQKALMSVHTSH